MQTLHIFTVATTGIYPFDESGPALALYAMINGMLQVSGAVSIELLVGVNNPKYLNFRCHPLLNVPMTPVLLSLKSVNGFRTAMKGCLKFESQIKNADVVFYNSPPADAISFAYPFIARLRRKKQSYYLHGSLVNEGVDSARRKYFYLVAHLGLLDKVIIPLESFKDCVSKLICPGEIIDAIPECVVTQWYEGPIKMPLEGDPSILYSGRLAQVKRVDVLLRALSTMISQYPDVKLYLAGSGPLEVSLKRLCTKLGLSAKVVFLGRVQHNRLRVVYRSADIFVLPSEAELMSLSLLEAMASKCAVVASDVAAAEVIENQQNGLIFPSGDFRMLASNMSILAGDKALRRKLSEKAYLTIKQKFDCRVVGSKLIEEMRNILIQ